MTACLVRVVDVIAAGKDAGVFDVEDVDLVANLLYALGLGGLQLARLGVMVREDAPGIPGVAGIDQLRLKEHLLTSSLALVRPASAATA